MEWPSNENNNEGTNSSQSTSNRQQTQQFQTPIDNLQLLAQLGSTPSTPILRPGQLLQHSIYDSISGNPNQCNPPAQQEQQLQQQQQGFDTVQPWMRPIYPRPPAMASPTSGSVPTSPPFQAGSPTTWVPSPANVATSQPAPLMLSPTEFQSPLPYSETVLPLPSPTSLSSASVEHGFTPQPTVALQQSWFTEYRRGFSDFDMDVELKMRDRELNGLIPDEIYMTSYYKLHLRLRADIGINPAVQKDMLVAKVFVLKCNVPLPALSHGEASTSGSATTTAELESVRSKFEQGSSLSFSNSLDIIFGTLHSSFENNEATLKFKFHESSYHHQNCQFRFRVVLYYRGSVTSTSSSNNNNEDSQSMSGLDTLKEVSDLRGMQQTGLITDSPRVSMGTPSESPTAPTTSLTASIPSASASTPVHLPAAPSTSSSTAHSLPSPMTPPLTPQHANKKKRVIKTTEAPLDMSNLCPLISKISAPFKVYSKRKRP